jgi:hypothetical protein
MRPNGWMKPPATTRPQRPANARLGESFIGKTPRSQYSPIQNPNDSSRSQVIQMDRYAQPVLYVPEPKARKADRQTTTQRLLDKVHPYATSIVDVVGPMRTTIEGKIPGGRTGSHSRNIKRAPDGEPLRRGQKDQIPHRDKSKVDESLHLSVSQNHNMEFDQIPDVNPFFAAPRPVRESPKAGEMLSASAAEKQPGSEVARGITDADRDFHAFVEKERRNDQKRRHRRHDQGLAKESDLLGPHPLAPGRRVRQGSVHSIESATEEETFGLPPKVPRVDPRSGAEANIHRRNPAHMQRPSKRDPGRFMKRSSTVDSNSTLKAFPQIYRTSAYGSTRSVSSAEHKENDTDDDDSDGSDVLVRSPICMDLATLGGFKEPTTEIEGNRRRRGSMLSRQTTQDAKPSGMDTANHGLGVVAVEKPRDEVERETDSAGSSASVVSTSSQSEADCGQENEELPRSITAIFVGVSATLPRSETAIRIAPTADHSPLLEATAAGDHRSAPDAEERTVTIPKRRPAVRGRISSDVSQGMRLRQGRDQDQGSRPRTPPAPSIFEFNRDESPGGVFLGVGDESFDGGKLHLPYRDMVFSLQLLMLDRGFFGRP